MKDYDAPLIGALAVVLQNGCVLLVKRGVKPHLGYWSLPGGVIDKGETAEEATIRETFEETGLNVTLVRELGVVTGPLSGMGHGIFLCQGMSGALKVCPPEVTAIQWISYNRLETLMLPEFIKKFLQCFNLLALEAES